MGIKIRKHGTVIAQFASAQQVDISHVNDSVALGDGSDLISSETVGAQNALIVKPVGGGDASASNQTDGSQKTQVVDSGGVVAEIDDVGGEKAIKVSVISTVGGGAAPAHTDDAAFSVGSDQMTPIGGVYQGTPDSVDDGDAGALRMTADRILMTAVQSSALPSGASTSAKQDTIIGHLDGVEGLLTTIDADTGSMATLLGTIDADTGAMVTDLAAIEVLLTQIDADTSNLSAILTDTGQIEALLTTIDADTGNLAGIKSDTAAMVTDLAAIEVLLTGIDADTNDIKTAVQILDNAINGNEMQVDIVTMPTATVAGGAAHDAAVSGNPVRVAGRAMLANGTAVAEDDTADLATDNQGRLIVTPHVPRDLVVQAAVTQTSTTEATLLAAGAAGVFHDVTKLVMTNSSSTATRVQIRDSTGGSIVLEVSLAANGGAVIDFGAVPMKQTTAANNWTIDLSGGVTSVYCFIQAIKRIA